MAQNTLDETRALKVLLAQVRAFSESIQDILHNQNAAETGRYSSFKDMACTYNDLAENARSLLRVPSMFYTFNVDKMPGIGDTVWTVHLYCKIEMALAKNILWESFLKNWNSPCFVLRFRGISRGVRVCVYSITPRSRNRSGIQKF